ncbi:hypothetical protein ACLK17_23455 [Escherichia coli]
MGSRVKPARRSRLVGGTSPGLPSATSHPEAASGGSIGLIEDGYSIAHRHPNCGIQLQVSDADWRRS